MKQSADVFGHVVFLGALALRRPDAKRQEKFYPSDVLVTARDIINLWAARMIFRMRIPRREPFGKVLIHGTILTKEGKRMSKSLGTGVDPLALISLYGADAVRFGLIWQAMGNQDIPLGRSRRYCRKKFANKIWNASRFVLMQNADSKPRLKAENLTEADKKILAELKRVKKATEKNLENFRFGPALRELHDFSGTLSATGTLKKQKKTNGRPRQAGKCRGGSLFCPSRIAENAPSFYAFLSPKKFTGSSRPPETKSRC